MKNFLQQFIDYWKDTNCYDQIECSVCRKYFRRGIGLRLHLYNMAHYPTWRTGEVDITKLAQQPEHLKLLKAIVEEEKKLPWWWRFTTY